MLCSEHRGLHETSRFRHASRRCGGRVAACGAGATIAKQNSGSWRPLARRQRRRGRCLPECVAEGIQRSRLCRRQKHCTDQRFPAENPERFRILARELVDEKPDVIIAVTNLGTVEVKRATSTIPIVFVLVPDPIGYGFVESLAHPGGNATGLSLMAVDLSGKRLELLKQAVPNLSRVALLTDPKTDPVRERTIKANQAAAQALGITLWSVDLAGPEDVEPAFVKIAQDRADGVVLGTGSAMFNMRERIGASAIEHKLPGVTYIAEEVPYGLLLSYGQDFPDFFRRAAGYVDKILKGAKPADLPVEQPTKFKLVLNLKTAKVLDLTIPQTLILSADEVIE
jgi:putative ABC transport system substrate-binding protein